MMTNEEINALTDQQINVMMTFAVNDLDESWAQSQSGSFVYYCAADGNSDTAITVEDYCNNSSSMMPIVLENGISLIKVGDSSDGGYCAHCPKMTRTGDLGSLIIFQSSKPMRAAALAYLRKKGAL
ncbi:MAG: hypothetical protein ACRCUK_02405 [Plesiomonas shigelloides]